MKNLIIIALVLLTSTIYSQENKPKLEAVGQSVKATYFHENGKIQQEGFFVKGKLDGNWTSFDNNGNKTVSGSYENGVKTGKWFFWTDNKLTEVDYSQNNVANVKIWTEGTIAKN